MMRILRRTAIGTAALVVTATTLLVAGCTAPRSADFPVSARTATAAPAKQTATGALIGALASCGLSPDDEGVVLGTKKGLALASQPRGRATDVVAATARCTLTDLGMPNKDGDLFDETLATGGFQTLQWGRWSATLKVTDTLRFEVDVIPQTA